ncbi:condensin-2 complex subunit H2 [Platichthys flesus]|uniref:condensin-2 complex subunit H2 n=1 Tax=Platichthys flesus TaxID=8260 RepID=UPI002DB694EB|nr:condensin-2 complex subunit H2 [Platichthys flesus]XP_062238288.1 condensin-2 complex subunit H2 [Platichthys flesus]XP_062238289.1 condensin-2 complex subunit H2 [Platichthys flesus]
MESTESRFAHLLQPIRELTKNWDVDVASELNDYLEELDEMCITFDGGKFRLNFAEAALLIQGSACIYSKKVELLHSLVYQTLEYINDRNKKRSKQSAESQEDDAAAGSRDEDEDENVFTPLEIQVTDTTQKTSVNKTVNVIPLPPASLIPPETHEKNKLPLISLKGEVLCSQKDFRMNLYIPGNRDMILLRSRSEEDSLPVQSLHVPHDADEQQLEEEEGALDAGDGGDGGDGGDAAENFYPLDDNNMELDQEAEEHVDRHQAPSDGRVIRERRQVEADQRRREEAPPAVNIWTFHDPYSVLGEEKPLKQEKCYKVPDGLDDKGKRKRRRASPLQDFRSWFRGTFDPPEHKLKNGPKFIDLNYIYVKTLKDKVKTQRRIYRQTGVVVSDVELRRTFLQPEEAGPDRQEEEPVHGFRHPDLLGGDDDNSDNEHEAVPDDPPAEFEGGADELAADAQRDELSYEDLVKLRVEQLVVNCRGYTQETALSRRVRDWEDKVRPELDLQEDRPVFDIRDYGDRIVRALSTVGHHRTFSSLVHGLDNFEACKYLLASLQLANDYTVDIDSAEGLDSGLDSMGLTLLSTDRATDRFESDGFGLKSSE